jgi:hypothetical protein
MNPFVIFGYMVWFVVTALLFVGGIAAAMGGLEDEDGPLLLGGTVAFLLSLLSASFFLSTLE